MEVKIEIIDTGYFYADGGAMFGAIPKTAWSRKYPSDEMNGCVLAMRSLLVQTADRCLLIDTGAGYKHLKSLSYYRFFGLKDLKEELRLRHISPDEITDVILTHLHFDHCGYCTLEEENKLQLAFPNATYWVSEKQWHAFRRPHRFFRKIWIWWNNPASFVWSRIRKCFARTFPFCWQMDIHPGRLSL